MRVLRAGKSALLVQCEPADVSAWYLALTDRRTAGLLHAEEIVPAARTILLDGVDSPSLVAAELESLPTSTASSAEQTTAAEPSRQRPSLVVIPTVYDGPDLDDVAELWGTDRSGVVDLHASIEFHVAFCGFAPGFAYLGGLPGHRHVPRRATPRERVPAGTVALAGEFCGIYPIASPGGWQCIGRTDLQLFDLDKNQPALLTPGTRVRFTAVHIR